MESTLVSYQKLVCARRWDFEYFDPEYQTIIDSIESSGWKICKLGEIVTSLTDGQHGYLVHLPEGIPLLRTTNIFENEIRLDDVRYIAPEVHTAIKRSQLKAGDVLLTTIGSLGIAAVVDNSLGEANINQNLVKMTPKPEINPLYLSLFLNSNLGKVQTQRTASKSVVPIINYSRLKDIVIPVPPRPLQDQIAQIMQDAYGDRKTKLKQAEELTHEISNHIPNVLDIHVSSSKNERSFVIKSSSVISKKRWDFDYFEPKYQDIINQIINSRWDAKRLSEVISVLTDGQHGYLEHLPSGVPLLRTTNIFENAIRLDSVRYIAPEVHAELTRSQLQPGDVLLTTVGSIGIAAVVDESLGEANINQNLVKLTPKPNINPYYLASFLNSSIGRIQTERTASKSVVPIVSYPRLRNILIPIPPRSIQDEVEKYMRNTLLEVRNLRSQAEIVVAVAKARVEQMILGEEVSDG